ncbi:helix-turn-helix transcriptional regulator [Gordonia terrae]
MTPPGRCRGRSCRAPSCRGRRRTCRCRTCRCRPCRSSSRRSAAHSVPVPDPDTPREHLLDPIGLIVSGETRYLVATSRRGGSAHDGDDSAERVYRLSRMTEVDVLDEPAHRSDDVDLAAIWERDREAFRRSFEPVEVVLDCSTEDAERIGSIAAATHLEDTANGRCRLELRFADRRHAVRALWAAMFDYDLVVREPDWLRDAITTRAMQVRGD